MVITNVGSYTRLAFGSVSTFLLDHLVALLSTAGYTSLSDQPNHIVAHNVKRSTHLPRNEAVAFAILIPILVLLSGLFAGLTLGYMSLDETQLNVLSISGTPQQREYAEKIKPIRKDGHLLLVTLLLANMIVNETLPVIADPVLGGGIQSVVVSTALIVIFSEIIPQSICTRHGLYFGAKMAGFVRVLLWTMGFLAWPIAKLLEIVLGPHHGIIYRRTELKELIAMHSDLGQYGGDLKMDTVTIIGATLDLQEKVVRQAMTPIQDVFMLSIDTKLDYETLRQICLTGHSRVPVYEEVEIPTSKVIEARNKAGAGVFPLAIESEDGKTMIVKRIIGILLVKQCVLLDPGDSIPLRKIPLNKVPFVPNNESLLGILDKFQEGRSHMAIVSRFSADKAASVKKAVKLSLTQRLRHRVGISDDSSSDEENGSSKSDSEGNKRVRDKEAHQEHDKEATLRGNGDWDKGYDTAQDDDEPKRSILLRSHKAHRKSRGARRSNSIGAHSRTDDIEMGIMDMDDARQKSRAASFTTLGLEQVTPADAVLAKDVVDDFLQILDPAIMPLGIITLEDVVEELIGEEIYDEFDPHDQGAQLSSYIPPEYDDIYETDHQPDLAGPPGTSARLPSVTNGSGSGSITTTPILKPIPTPAFKGFNFLIPRSATPGSREPDGTEGVATGTKALSAATVEPTVQDVSGKARISLQHDQPRPLSDTALDSQSPSVLADFPVHPEPVLVRKRPALETTLVPAITAGSPPYSKSTSAASLEAILLDRKRRGVTASSAHMHVVPSGPNNNSGGVPARVATPNSNKGKSGFKSSPLGGPEKIGVVVAEVVKKEDTAGDFGGSGRERKFPADN